MYTIIHGGMKAQMTIWLICQELNTNLHHSDGQSLTTEQKQAFEAGPEIRSSNTYLIVKNERSNRAILAALGDTELQKILDATMLIESVSQIIRDTEIPHTAPYRRIGGFLKKSCL